MRSSTLRSGHKFAFFFLLFIGVILILRQQRSFELNSDDDYSIDPLQWPTPNGNDDGESAFSQYMFSAEAFAKNHLKPVTAIVLRVTVDDETIVNVRYITAEIPLHQGDFTFTILSRLALFISR